MLKNKKKFFHKIVSSFITRALIEPPSYIYIYIRDLVYEKRAYVRKLVFEKTAVKSKQTRLVSLKSEK